jgi:chemotaxis protein CheC
MKFAALSARQLDILREVSNIGVGHAATALSQMIGRDVSMRVPRVRIAPFSEVPETVGGAEKLMAGVFCSVTGDVTGYILLVFPSDSAKSLGRLLMGRELEPDEGWYEDAESAIGEVGNILSSAYLNALGSLLSMTLIPSIPATAFDMAGAILDTVLIEQSRSDDLALLIETEFFEKEETITGHFFLVPGPESVAVVLEKLGAGPQ